MIPNMKNILIPFRYFVFAAFIVCNAISCSTAVWNLALSQEAGRLLSVDVFVTLVGASALAFIFTIIIIELVNRELVTGRVWFECMWVGFFSLLEFCAAVALSVIGPGVMCNALVTEFIVDSCTSTRVVLAFLWICTSILLAYLILLTTSAYMHKNENPQIWSCSVRWFDWSGTRSYIGSDGPKSLSLPHFVEKKRPGSLIIVPKPRQTGFYAQPNMGIDSDEHLQPQMQPAPAMTVERPLPVVPAPEVHQPQRTRETASSFYPRHMQSVVASQPQQPSYFSKPMKELPRSSSPPPPLGDWPRPSIISEPRSKRQQQPSRGFTVPPASSHRPQPSSESTRPLRPMRPTHRSTRSGSTSADRRRIPPPLDLSKISSHTRHRS